jgi:hypothetical protein
VVHVLAMHNRKVLPVAGTRAGRPLALRVTSWSLVEKRYGKIQSGNLPTVTLEIEKPLLWGEVEGQPRLTDGELARVGQEDSTAARAAADADPPRPPSGAAPAAVAPETTPREAAQGESTWRLELGACVAGKPLVVYLACREGKPWRAFGQTPTYNKAVHDVEIAELKVADGRVSGPLVLTVHPDAWVPSDGKPVAGRVDVRAEARDGKVTGTYEGRLGAAAVKGSVSGEVETGDLVPAGKVELLLENALQGEQPHYRTLNVSLPIVRGQFGTGGSVRGFHPRAWTGKIEKMDARLTPGAIAGRIEVSVQSGITPVGEGVYSFDLDGAVIGKVTAGSFKAGYKGGSLPGGKFFGKIVP